MQISPCSGQDYSSDKISEWISQIADNVNTRVKDLNMKRYKHIVQVVIVQKGAGCRYNLFLIFLPLKKRCFVTRKLFLDIFLGADGTLNAIVK